MPLFSDFERPDWSREGAGWPNRAASRFVQAGGLRWHVQIMGEGSPLLLVQMHTVIAPDPPGHGFMQGMAWRDVSLAGMAARWRKCARRSPSSPGSKTSPSRRARRTKLKP